MNEEDDIDHEKVNYEDLLCELEAIEVIFPEEYKLLTSKPYKIEIQINANADPDDNYLKMLLVCEIPHDYPNNIPFM